MPEKRTPPERFHVCQSSMQFSDDRGQVREDVVRLLTRPVEWNDGKRSLPDAINFTEAGNRPVDPVIRNQTARHGYHVFDAPGGAKMAVRDRHTPLTAAFTAVIAARKQPDGKPGSYGVRGVQTVSLETPAGNQITVAGAHWLTDYKLGDNPGDNRRREASNEALTDAMVAEVQEMGAGRRIVFWTGDTNVDERRDRGRDRRAPHAKFTAGGLVSIYDELGTYPLTGHGKVLDIVGSYSRDGRVLALEVHVGQIRNSDHRDVHGLYAIRGRLIKDDR